MLESLNNLQILLLTISVSLLFFTVISVFVLLAIFNGSGFITPTISIPGASMIGAGLGIIHGLLTGLFLIWRRSDSTFNLLIGSGCAAEIISVIIVVSLLLINMKSYISFSPTMSFSDYLSAGFNVLLAFLFISFVLLVPSILIALISRLILFHFVK